MSEQGIIFDIKQMAVFDGPGIRTTVFLKGCPLRCMWCHNQEGLSRRPQIMKSGNGCLQCGKCRDICLHPESCIQCGACVYVCPKNLIHISGKKWEAKELVKKLRKDKEYLQCVNGGITFSGGEPLLQPEFLLECLDGLMDMHTCIETSGYAAAEVFSQVIDRLDYVIMDVKLMDEMKHKYYTGVSNQQILQNLEYLKESGKPFRIRIPVIPGVNDDRENCRRTAQILKNSRNLDFVELLPYHRTAGAKYSMIGKKYEPVFDETLEPCMWPEVFEQEGIPCKLM